MSTDSHKSQKPGHLALVMGTAGHIDHGKTSLVRALTGVNLDRLAEEKRRGITIELGFVSLELSDSRRIGVVDVPGHERFIKTMVAGAQGIDFVMLVVAADEGVMPQTVEHFDICKLLGVRKGLVALTKCDRADAETISLAAEEIREMAAGSFLENAPIVPCSSVTGEGIEKLREVIAQVASELVPRSGEGIFRMPVDRSFSVKGFGTVITGTVTSGRVGRGDEVEILPGHARATVRDLEVHGEKVETAGAGQRLAINLSGIDRKEIARGQWVIEAGRIGLTRTIDAWVSVLPTHRAPIEHSREIGFHVGTAFIIAELDLLGADCILPGEDGPARLHLKEPLPLIAGDRFVLRSYARKTTVAGGEIIDPMPKSRTEHRGRKGKKAVADFIREIVTGNAEERIEKLIEASGFTGVSRSQLHLRAPVMLSETDSIIAKLAKSGELICARNSDLLITLGNFKALSEELKETLAQYHKSNPLETGPSRAAFSGMRRRRIPDEIYESVLHALVDSEDVAFEGDKLRLKSHKPSASGVDKKALDSVEQLLKNAGNTPPTIAEISQKLGRDKKDMSALLKHMMETGLVCKVSDELYFHHAVIAEIKSKLVEHLSRHDGIEPVDFKDMVGVSRKFAIPLLEYFDRERLTMRVGNRRVLRQGGK